MFCLQLIKLVRRDGLSVMRSGFDLSITYSKVQVTSDETSFVRIKQMTSNYPIIINSIKHIVIQGFHGKDFSGSLIWQFQKLNSTISTHQSNNNNFIPDFLYLGFTKIPLFILFSMIGYSLYSTLS